jgi:ABC-2 type transport system permease protein
VLGAVIGSNSVNPADDVTNNILGCIALAQVVFGSLGALVVTGEFSSGTIHATLAAIPNRALLLAAKAGVFGVVVLVAGEVTVFVAFFAGKAALGPHVPQPSLSQPDVLRAVVFTGFYLALIGLIGLALGAIVRHSAGAICLLVGVVFVLPALRLGGHAGMRFFPEIIAANSLSTTHPVGGQLPALAGLAMIALYAAVLLAVAGYELVRRDA